MQELKNISSSDTSSTVSFKDFFTSLQMLGIALHDGKDWRITVDDDIDLGLSSGEMEVLFRRFKEGNYVQFSEFSSKALEILQGFLGRDCFSSYNS